MPERINQRQKLLKLLRESCGEWVGLPKILDLRISQYSARVHELRAQGHVIDNHTRHVNGVVHSWFRLVEPEPKRIGRHFLETHPRGFSDVG